MPNYLCSHCNSNVSAEALQLNRLHTCSGHVDIGSDLRGLLSLYSLVVNTNVRCFTMRPSQTPRDKLV